jgi:hypothetical protein
MESGRHLLSSDTLAFVEKVVIDGRHIEDLQEHPHSIARALGIGLSDESAHQIQSGDRQRILRQLYEYKFTGPKAQEGRHPTIIAEKTTAGFGGAIIVGIIGGIALTAIAVAVKGRRRPAPPPPPPGGGGGG